MTRLLLVLLFAVWTMGQPGVFVVDNPRIIAIINTEMVTELPDIGPEQGGKVRTGQQSIVVSATSSTITLSEHILWENNKSEKTGFIIHIPRNKWRELAEAVSKELDKEIK